MTTIDDATVRLAHIAKARACLEAASISLGNAERVMRQARNAGSPRGPMYSLSDGQMRAFAQDIAYLASGAALIAGQLERLEERQ